MCEVDQEVRWFSQAQGQKKEKRGVVVAIIPTRHWVNADTVAQVLGMDSIEVIA